MDLTQEQIELLINNYKKKREREKQYYHTEQKTNEDYIKKNRERAKQHYAENKDKKREKYEKNKDFLIARQQFYYYKKNDNLDKFKNKHEDKYNMLVQRGVIIEE